MAVQEDIFEEFFNKLEEDEDIPNSIVEELKRIWVTGEIGSQDAILEVIENESENGS